MYRAKLKKRVFILLACGLALSAAAAAGCWALTFPGVDIRRVAFDTGEYESPARRVSGLLITPDNPVSDPAPGVVFVHGFLMSKEVYFGPARELAKRGVPVLAIDLRGHGSTGGRGDQNFTEVYDALAAVDYLASLPGVDPDRIA
ncbi:MAG: alpha/beta fold hydrolase, partial [Gemmatimonadetes bacterium]|nr:alpha/beta fold hydrolase [Gemmatimonadota bacterium]